MKILKYISILLFTILIGVVGYIYSLTFTPHGRLNWGQALFLKMGDGAVGQIEQLKKMSVSERAHTADAVAVNLDGLHIDTLKITKDSLTTYIFKPKKLAKNSPVVVFFHGGGFTLPWTNISAVGASRFSRVFNTIVVAVDYRVAPEHPFPMPNNDCYATLLWTIANIKDWGGNPNQIILAGGSAGATLAATVAIKAMRQHLTNIKYQILDCPVTYLPFQTDSYQKLKSKNQEAEKYALESYLPNIADRSNPLALPYLADSLSNLPPTYIVTCEFDPIKDTGRDYAIKLKNAKVPVIHQEMKGMIHSMAGPFNEKDRTELCAEIAKASQKYVK